jgi:hypothetical protein
MAGVISEPSQVAATRQHGFDSELQVFPELECALEGVQVPGLGREQVPGVEKEQLSEFGRVRIPELERVMMVRTQPGIGSSGGMSVYVSHK